MAEWREVTIGPCRLINADCLRVIPNLDIDGNWSLITDPPYGMAFQSNRRMVRHREIINDDDVAMLRWASELRVPNSKYIFCRWDNLTDVPKPKSFITWIKNNWSMGDLLHEHARQTEGILFYAGPRHAFGSGRPTDIVYASRAGNDHHPTEKPVHLIEDMIGWTSSSVIVDPFMGSGTTGVACVRLRRNFVGIEKDPEHFDTACKRIQRAWDDKCSELPFEKEPELVQKGLFNAS